MLKPHSCCVCPTPIACLIWVRGWVGGCPHPPPLQGGGGWDICPSGYAKILGGWVPELPPPPLGWVSKTLLLPQPIPPHRFSPPLLLSLITTTARYLTGHDHRSLFDRVSAYFGRFFKVHLPYRVTLRLPLLTRPVKLALRFRTESTFQSLNLWPPPLQWYLADRVTLVNCKLRSVSDRLVTRNLDSYPTAAPDLLRPRKLPTPVAHFCPVLYPKRAV